MNFLEAKQLSEFRSKMAKGRAAYMNEMKGLAMGFPDDPEALQQAILEIEIRYRRKLETLRSEYRSIT